MSNRIIAVATLVVFGAAAVISGIACKGKSAREAVAEKSLENMLEKASGGKVDLDLKAGTMKVKTAEGESVLTTGERTWPEDLPASAVRLEPGEVQTVTRAANEEGKTWNVHLAGIGDQALDDYAAKLKDAGWTIMATTAMGRGGMIQANKDDLTASVIINAEQKSAVLSFHQSKEK